MCAPARVWLELTKPGITLFIVLTAGAAFVTAQGGFGQPIVMLATLAATGLMSAGAATLNQVTESAADARMKRTARRPIPSGAIGVREATGFAWSLSSAGLALALLALPWLAALMLVLCHVSYVDVYTPLKRRTPLCTLAGAIPGALPVLAGWTASGAPIGPGAIALTGVLFMWQIPHFLALGWLGREEYARAGCPMLGVGDPTGEASARIALAYAVAMAVCAVAITVMPRIGAIYLAIALVTCGAYAAAAWSFVRQPERGAARRLFLSSLAVLPLLLAALVLDVLIS
ncbi:MAG TPA: heme o synthase [Longimicrobiales bacterium]